MRYGVRLVHPTYIQFKLNTMFKSRFIETMERSEGFEVIKDADALSVQGGTNCEVLTSCGNFHGDCSNLTNCGTYTDDPVNAIK